MVLPRERFFFCCFCFFSFLEALPLLLLLLLAVVLALLGGLVGLGRLACEVLLELELVPRVRASLPSAAEEGCFRFFEPWWPLLELSLNRLIENGDLVGWVGAGGLCARRTRDDGK
jgi:hypothetical protein